MCGVFFFDFLRDRINVEFTPACCSSTNIGSKLCAALGCAVLPGN